MRGATWLQVNVLQITMRLVCHLNFCTVYFWSCLKALQDDNNEEGDPVTSQCCTGRALGQSRGKLPSSDYSLRVHPLRTSSN